MLPYQESTLTYSTDLRDGYCPGDYFTIGLPRQLAAQNGNSYVLPDPSGATVATMTIENGQVKVTLSDFVRTHQSVHVQGYLGVQVQSDVTPGESTSFTVTVNGVATTPIAVTIGKCPGPGCTTTLPTAPTKWGYVDAGGNVMVTIQTTPSTDAGQSFTITDNLSSPGQQFPCSSNSVSAQYYTSLDQFGNPTSFTDLPSTVTACATKAETITVTSTAKGQVFRIYIPVTVTDPSQPSWTDQAQVTAPGQETTAISATVTRADGGGSGSGQVPVPTPPPATTPPPPVTTPPVTTPPPVTPSAPMAPVASGPSAGVPVASKSTPAALAFTGLPGYLLLIGAGGLLLGGVGLSVAGRRRSTR